MSSLNPIQDTPKMNDTAILLLWGLRVLTNTERVRSGKVQCMNKAPDYFRKDTSSSTSGNSSQTSIFRHIRVAQWKSATWNLRRFKRKRRKRMTDEWMSIGIWHMTGLCSNGNCRCLLWSLDWLTLEYQQWRRSADWESCEKSNPLLLRSSLSNWLTFVCSFLYLETSFLPIWNIHSSLDDQLTPDGYHTLENRFMKSFHSPI